MEWQFLIMGSVVLYAVSVLLQRALIRQDSSHPKAFAILYQFLCGLLIGAAGLFSSKLNFSGWTTSIVPLGLSTLLYALGNVSIFNALKHVEASRFTILFSLRGVVTVLGALLLFHETLSAAQILGIVLVLVGVAILHNRALSLRFSKQELPALAAALFFGLANLSDRAALVHMELYTFVSLAFLLPPLVLLVGEPSVMTPLRQLWTWEALKPMLLLAVVYSTGAVLFFAALQMGSTSQVAAINLSSVILIVLLSAVFLKERTDLARKLLAALVTFVGLVLVG